MIEEVSCHNGRCWENETKNNQKSHFNDMFDDSNIVDQIEKDIWLYNFYD